MHFQLETFVIKILFRVISQGRAFESSLVPKKEKQTETSHSTRERLDDIVNSRAT